LPGYRRRVWADLRQAMALPTTGPDVDQVRATVLACLGDPIGLDPIEDPTAVRRRKQPGLPTGAERWAREAANGGPIAVSPDADLVAVAERPGGRVAVYSRDGKRLRQERSPLGGVYDLALAADGKLLVAGCEQGFVAWDLPGPDRWVVRAGNITSVAISPNSRLLASGGRQLELWSLATKRPILSLPAPPSGARVEFSADGRALLAVVNGAPVAGWPVCDTPERRVLDGHALGVPSLVFSPDGRRLASVSKDRTARLWDAATGRPLRTLTGHTGEIEAVAFHPDGSLLATGDFAGAVRVWDARSGDLRAETGRAGLPGQVWRLEFGAGGKYLAAAGAKGAMTWTVQAAPDRVAVEPLCPFPTSGGPPGVIDLATRPGGTELVFLTGAGGLFTYDLARADGTRRLAVRARGSLRSLHFTAAGDRFTIITPRGTLGVWDWQGKAPNDTRHRAATVAVSADGRWVALAGAGQSVTVAELVSGREVLALPPEGADVWCLAWAPDGTRLAAGLSDGTVAIWDLGLVRARLAEFGIDSPSTARHKDTRRPPQPVPDFDRVVEVNRLRAEGQDAYRRGVTARKAGDPVAARDHLQVALDRYRRLASAVPAGVRHRHHLANAHQALAGLEDTAAALGHLEAEARLRERLAADDPANPEHRRGLAICLTHRSRLRDRAGQPQQAVADARRVTALREKLASDPGTPADRLQLGIAYHNLAFQFGRAGRLAEAQHWYHAALTAHDRLAADDPKLRASRATTLHNLGILRARAGQTSAAEKLLREAAAVRGRLADDFPANPDYASDAGRTLEWLGGALLDRGKLDEAVRVFREAIRRQRAALGLRPTDRVFRDLCRNHQDHLAVTLLKMARHADAAAAARELPRLARDDPRVLLRAARLLACCAAGAARDRRLPWSRRLLLVRTYSREAIGLTWRAVAKGLFALDSFILLPVFVEQQHVPSLVATMGALAVPLIRAHSARSALSPGPGKAGGPHGPQFRGSRRVRPAGGAAGRGDGAFRGQDRAAGRRHG
jgi:WD40 repeat protein/tetratricopeptide (TPR) repeat protein